MKKEEEGMKRTAGAVTCIIVGTTLMLSACTKKPVNLPEEEIKPTPVEQQIEEEEIIDHTGEAISPLTGLWIKEEAAERRPFTVMINNLKQALPQSGISQADMIYETLVEGDITRLLAVFQDFNAEKIGPVRSARHYYLDFAFDVDGIYVHYGKSPQALQAFKDLRTDNLEGLSGLDSMMCWRDPVRAKQKGMYEHSVYTSAERLMKTLEAVNYRKERREGLQPLFKFAEEEMIPQGENAGEVVLPFSDQHVAKFQFDAASKLYKRSQFNAPHIDAETGKQLEVKNVVVQYANIRTIQGDTAGRRDVDLVGSGKGVYISNGKALPITWSKKDHKIPTEYKDAQGNPLQINKGKTWICIFPTNKKISVQ